jgi:hypothetical protein
MVGDDRSARLDACLGAFILSGMVWAFVMLLGWMLTPPDTYNEPAGAIIPICVFGFSGALAASASFAFAMAVFRSPRLSPLTPVPRFIIAGVVAACLCGAATYWGVRHMEAHPSRYIG